MERCGEKRAERLEDYAGREKTSTINGKWMTKEEGRSAWDKNLIS